MPAGPRLAATEAMLRVCFFPLPQGGRRDEWAGADRTNNSGHRCRRRPRFKKLEEHRRRLRCTTLFVLLLVFVLSPPRRTVLVLVFEAIQYSNPAHWSASSRERLRSTIRIAAVQTAIEYEYRFTEYRFAEYEYDEIRCEARTKRSPQTRSCVGWNAPGPRSARPTGSTASSASGRLRRKVGMVEMIRLADEPWAPVAQGHPGAEVVR
jgi:hypothetical protein